MDQSQKLQKEANLVWARVLCGSQFRTYWLFSPNNKEMICYLTNVWWIDCDQESTRISILMTTEMFLWQFSVSFEKNIAHKFTNKICTILSHEFPSLCTILSHEFPLSGEEFCKVWLTRTSKYSFYLSNKISHQELPWYPYQIDPFINYNYLMRRSDQTFFDSANDSKCRRFQIYYTPFGFRNHQY